MALFDPGVGPPETLHPWVGEEDPREVCYADPEDPFAACRTRLASSGESAGIYVSMLVVVIMQHSHAIF